MTNDERQMSDDERRKTLDLIHRAEAVIGIKKGLDSLARGEGIPAEKAFEKLRKKHGIRPDA